MPKEILRKPPSPQVIKRGFNDVETDALKRIEGNALANTVGEGAVEVEAEQTYKKATKMKIKSVSMDAEIWDTLREMVYRREIKSASSYIIDLIKADLAKRQR